MDVDVESAESSSDLDFDFDPIHDVEMAAAAAGVAMEQQQASSKKGGDANDTTAVHDELPSLEKLVMQRGLEKQRVATKDEVL